jgi:hypothetical protein
MNFMWKAINLLMVLYFFFLYMYLPVICDCKKMLFWLVWFMVLNLAYKFQTICRRETCCQAQNKCMTWLDISGGHKNDHIEVYTGAIMSWLYGSWIYNYLCNRCLSPLTLWWGVLTSTLCDKVCQWLVINFKRFAEGKLVVKRKTNVWHG